VKDIDLHRSATAEMIEAARFYERRRNGVGFRFLQYFFTGPYNVVYRVEEQRVLVLAVMHHRRRPGYWVWRRYR